MAEFVHPCDYTVIRNLIPTKITEQTIDLPVKVRKKNYSDFIIRQVNKGFLLIKGDSACIVPFASFSLFLGEGGDGI